MSKAPAKDQLPDTKRKLLEAAMSLMTRQGFSATTVDQICAEAELTKGSFFHYFKSKDEVGLETVEHYFAQMQARFAQAEFHQLADPLARLHGFLDFIAQGACASGPVQGCLMGNLTQELSNTHPHFRTRCAENFNGLAGHVQTLLREAGAKHSTRAAFDPESVATLFISLMQGSLLLAKARQDRTVLVENVAHFRAYVDLLFGKAKRR